ncbi:Co-chaperone protein p23-1 [Heracleum sosnowskyi]|uniref:Co-chaperone protein p23 n=1 Tax=Heracleum sosnowskyi TaxID=360622 RepID=A0AAD8MBT6_9APIA|nr:Co-chaperone protein p23-1 [Heracleum sosnowskyi]
MSRHPSVKWAQRSDVLFITIDLPDAKDVKLKLEPEGKFYFSATSGPEKLLYEIDIDLYDEVDVNESKASVGSRNIIYLIKKVESKWWSRLLKKEGKPPVFLKIDWNKWIDEDEQEEEDEGNMDLDDINFSGLQMGGSGGDYGETLDDEDGGDDDDDDDDVDSDTEEDIKGEEAPDNGKSEPDDEKAPASSNPEPKS